jgi:hypothetical protein
MGMNNVGAAVASGVYFCELKTSRFVEAKKLVLMK